MLVLPELFDVSEQRCLLGLVYYTMLLVVFEKCLVKCKTLFAIFVGCEHMADSSAGKEGGLRFLCVLGPNKGHLEDGAPVVIRLRH